MRDLLFLAHRVPFPPDRGDKIRSYHILRHLSRDWRIHLCTFGESEADLAQREAELRRRFCNGEVSVAVGSLWAPDGRGNFDKLFQEVDARMYADKRRHYGERRKNAEQTTG